MFVLGLTGDIGAGKSTVASLFRDMGARIIDADLIVKKLWCEPELLQAAKVRWGDSVIAENGEISFSGIADKVFSDEADYRWLCDLIHPMVRRDMTAGLASERGWVVVEIPLMFESGVPYWCDMTAYVTASQEIRSNRNGHRGLSMDMLQKREEFMLPSEEKRNSADLVIHNEGSLGELRDFLTPYGEKMQRMASICTVKIQCAFRKQARQIISGVLGKKLAYQANLSSVETAYSKYEQFLTENWEVQFYTLANLVPAISEEAASIMKKPPVPVAVSDVLRASLPFREALCGACR